jgi:DNA-binding NarL/FixJ family response regulator
LNGGRWRGLPLPDTPAFAGWLVTIRAGLPELSPMQAAVALGVWAGLTEKEIAGWLDRSPETIHDHVRDGCRRLAARGIQRRTDLVRVVERAWDAGHP